MEDDCNIKSQSTSSKLIQGPESQYPDFELFSQRMNSFVTKRWPIGLAQTPEQLAHAGFFYTGFSDQVLCFQCGGGLNNWEPHDNPSLEHLRWFPTCMFIQLMKIEEDPSFHTKKDSCTNRNTTPATPDFQKNVASLRYEASCCKTNSFTMSKRISCAFFLLRNTIKKQMKRASEFFDALSCKR